MMKEKRKREKHRGKVHRKSSKPKSKSKKRKRQRDNDDRSDTRRDRDKHRHRCLSSDDDDLINHSDDERGSTRRDRNEGPEEMFVPCFGSAACGVCDLSCKLGCTDRARREAAEAAAAVNPDGIKFVITPLPKEYYGGAGRTYPPDEVVGPALPPPPEPGSVAPEALAGPRPSMAPRPSRSLTARCSDGRSPSRAAPSSSSIRPSRCSWGGEPSRRAPHRL